jgi:hypothetical protein
MPPEKFIGLVAKQKTILHHHPSNAFIHVFPLKTQAKII